MLRLIFITGALFFDSALAKEIVYDDLLDLVSTQNQQVLAKKKEISASKIRAGFLLGSYLPAITTHIGQQSNYNELEETDSSLSLDQAFLKVEGSINLYRNGTDWLESDRRSLDLLVAGVELDQTLRAALLQARTLFWEIIALKEKIRLQKTTIKTNTYYKAIAQKQNQVGYNARSDLLEIKMHESQLSAELKILYWALKKAKNQFFMVIGHHLDEQFDPKVGFSMPVKDDLKNQIISAKEVPEALILQLKKEILEIESKVSSRSRLPEINLITSHKSYLSDLGHDRIKGEWTAEIMLTMDLFDSYESTKQASSQRVLSQAQDLQTNYKVQSIEATELDLRNSLGLYYELIHDAQHRVSDTTKFLNLSLSEYNRGVKNSSDVLHATSLNLESQKNLLDLYFRYYSCRSQLLAFLGQ